MPLGTVRTARPREYPQKRPLAANLPGALHKHVAHLAAHPQRGVSCPLRLAPPAALPTHERKEGSMPLCKNTVLFGLGCLMACLCAAPLHAAKPRKGDTCELTAPLLGKGLHGKRPLAKAALLSVEDVGKKVTVVKLGTELVSVATLALAKACKIKSAEADAAPPVAAGPAAGIPAAAPVAALPQPTPAPAAAAVPSTPATPATPATPTSASSTGGTVVVTNFKAAGVSAADAQLVTAKVADYLANNSAYSIITMAELSSMNEYHQTLSNMGCDGDTCMAQLAKLANASLALSGSVGKVGQETVINLSLINVDASKSVAAGSAHLASLEGAEGLDKAMPALCADIVGTGSGGPAAAAHYRLPAGQKTAFAVFDLKAQGLSEDAARNLTQLLAVEIKKIEGTTVVSRDDINAMLQMQTQKDQLGCDSVACLAEIGGALGVDNLIVGDVGKVANRYIVTLRMLDVRNSRALGRVNETFEGQEDQLLAAVRQAGRRLVGVDGAEGAAEGGLAIATNQQKANIFLDGDLAGASPLPPLKTLRNGKHSVRVSKDGFIDWRSDVFVEANNTTALWCALDEEPQKWYQKWWVWTLVGGAAALGTGAALYFTQAAPTTGQGTAYLPQ